MPLQVYGQKFRFCIVKIVDDHKNIYHNTQVTHIYYFQLMMINMRR